MAIQLQLRRGTTAQHSTFTGAAGEVTVNTTLNSLVVHDGVTAGGHPLAIGVSVDSVLTKTVTGGVTLTADEFAKTNHEYSSAGIATVTVPATVHNFTADNKSAFTITVKTAAQVTGVTVLAGQSKALYCNGTDVEDANSAKLNVGDLDTQLANRYLAYGNQIQPITASVAGNALTLTINATAIEFRSGTLTDGTVNKRTVGSPVSMTVSNGSTLGTTNGVASRIAVLAIDNAGTVEVACVNLNGGTALDEDSLISTTAEGGAGAADSATTIYSTTARSNVPFRVVGVVTITEATAGSWVSSPTVIQGIGGQIHAVGCSEVRVNTANGYGSTNTKIRRFTNVVTNIGSDVTYADSAANGGSFTINKEGVYSVSYSDQGNTSGVMGLSLNSATLTTNIQSCAASSILAAAQMNTNLGNCVAWTGFLSIGDVVRAHTDGTASGTNPNLAQFTIARVR